MFKRNRFKRIRTEVDIDSSNGPKKLCLENMETNVNKDSSSQNSTHMEIDSMHGPTNTESILNLRRIEDFNEETTINIDRNIFISSTYSNVKEDVESKEEFCQVCQKSINGKLKEHSEKCLKNLSTDKEDEIMKKLNESQTEKILPCSMCNKTHNLSDVQLKKCPPEYVISHDSMQSMTKPLEERNFLLKDFSGRTLRGKLMTALNTASMMKFKEAPKRNKLRLEEPKTKFEEDVQLAIALSTLEDKQDNSKALNRKKEKSLKPKTCELTHPLMAISSEDCKILTQDKFTQMLSEQSTIKHTLKDLKILRTDLSRSCLSGKYQAKRNLWNINSKFKSHVNLFIVSENFGLQGSKLGEMLFNGNLKKTGPFPKQNTEPPFTQTAHLLTELATDYCYAKYDIKESKCFAENVSHMQVPPGVRVDYSNLMNGFLLMVNNPVLSDLILLLDEGYRFHVHKFILLVKCPKLFEIISDKKEYQLLSFTLMTVQSFFEFIYASVVTFDHSIVQTVLKLAQRFEVIDLINICKSHMKTVSHLINEESEDEFHKRQHNIDKLNVVEEENVDEIGLDEEYEYIIRQRKLNQESEKNSDTKEDWISKENEDICSTFLNEMKLSIINFDDTITKECNNMNNIDFEIGKSCSTPTVIQENLRKNSPKIFDNSLVKGTTYEHLILNEIKLRKQSQDVVACKNEKFEYNAVQHENMNKFECRICLNEKAEYGCNKSTNNIAGYNHICTDNMEYIWDNFQESFYIGNQESSNIEPLIKVDQDNYKNSMLQYQTPKKFNLNNIMYSPPTDISHLESPDAESKNTIITNKELKYCLTPILKYENMDTLVLKEHCHKFGVRIMPKTKMVKVLKKIYYSTHPSVPRTPIVSKKPASHKNDIPRQSQFLRHDSKKTTVGTSMKEMGLTSSYEETMEKRVLTFKKKRSIGYASPNVELIPNIFSNSSYINTNKVNKSTDMTFSQNANMFKSSRMEEINGTDEFNNERKCFEEYFCDEFDDAVEGNKYENNDNPTQKSVKFVKLTESQKYEQLFEFFQSKERFLQILHYKPFELNDLVACIRSNNIKISKQFLVEFMDEKNILFTTRYSSRYSFHNSTAKISCGEENSKEAIM